MEKDLIIENEFSYIENGDGTPIVILHGLMGGLSNFKGVYEEFPKKNYKVINVDFVSIIHVNFN